MTGQIEQYLEQELASLRQQLAEAKRDAARYNELLYAVAKKHPDETRHETALRYIRQAEQPKDDQCQHDYNDLNHKLFNTEREVSNLTAQLAEANQELQTTADALGHKEYELQNIVERNRELELCVARHADEMYTNRRKLKEAKVDADNLRHGLENCRLLAARHRKEDWALLILGFCAEAGVAGSVTREIVNPVGKESQAVRDSMLKGE